MITLDQVLVRLEQGDLGYRRPQSNVVRDVALALALEEHEPQAAEIFERELMPLVRAVARRSLGNRGLDAVDNFAADLVLPRDSAPTRIAGYQGRTSLRAWLRVVTAHHCLSLVRRSGPVPIAGDVMDPKPEFPESDSHDLDECRRLLGPLFANAVESLEAEDRLLIRLLVLDEVPQQVLARRLGIHSGNVTRRRQRAADRIWGRLRDLQSRSDAGGRVSDCLEQVLAGDSVEVRRALGDVLARAISTPDDSTRNHG